MSASDSILMATPPRNTTGRIQSRTTTPIQNPFDACEVIHGMCYATAAASGSSPSPQRNNNTAPAVVLATSTVDSSFHTSSSCGTEASSTNNGAYNNDQDSIVTSGTNAVIQGYLYKLGRNGKWQTRWFETDGACLTYYKKSTRTKLLATLDLEKVGRIEVDTNDTKGCSFTIQVLGRDYHLRATTRAECKDWVITLLRVKEARLQQGNVKLVVDTPAHQPQTLMDLLGGGSTSTSAPPATPRIVVIANRQRTRAVDDATDAWEMMNTNTTVDINNNNNNSTADTQDSRKRRSTLGTVVLARWTKQRSSLSRLTAKLASWARKWKPYSCATDAPGSIDENSNAAPQLDRHVHPPGHDDTAIVQHPKQVLLQTQQQPLQQQQHQQHVTNTSIQSRPTRASSEDDARTIS